MYFILLGPFVSACLCLIWLREPIFCLGRNIFVLYVRFCPRHELLRLLSRTARLWGRLSFRNELLYIRSGTVRLREPGFVQNQVFSVCGPGPLGSGAGFRFGTNCFIYGPGPFGSGSRVLFKTTYLVYAVRERLALGACSLFRKNFCWSAQGAGSFSFVWSEILLCMRSGTARLREPFCLG